MTMASHNHITQAKVCGSGMSQRATYPRWRGYVPARAGIGFLVIALGGALVVPSGCSGRSGASGRAFDGQRSVFGRKGAPWTILCLELSGPHRVPHIEQFADTLRRTPGIRAGDVFVRDESDGCARLYYGTYLRRTDPETGRRSMPRSMREDIDLIKQLGGPSNKRYFLRAFAVRMPTPDVGRPEWRLTNAPGVYSLQVAGFEPTDDFWEHKQAAADFCEFLRGRGYEAYYYHSNALSEVTVGSFGADAVILRPDGLTAYSAEVLRLQQDELLKYNLLNGGIRYVHDGHGQRVAVPSRLVEIPEKPTVGSNP